MRTIVLPTLAGVGLLVAALPAGACEPVAFSRGVRSLQSRSFAQSSFAYPAYGCPGNQSGYSFNGYQSGSGFSRSQSFFEEEEFDLDEEEEFEESYQTAALRGGFGLRSGSQFRSGFLSRRQRGLDLDLSLRLRSRPRFIPCRPHILFRGRSRSHCW
jgi:hypothetical protein